MRTSDAGIALIKHFEGFSAQSYRCPAGYLTIGYGHVVHDAKRFTDGIDNAAAGQLLRVDLQLAEQAISRLIRVPLTQFQFDALASFTYNLGAGRLQMSRLRQCVNRGEFAAALHEFLRWVYVHGRVLKGLVARRHAEAELFEGMRYGAHASDPKTAGNLWFLNQ